MKKIINGKLYNTETAVTLGSYTSEGAARDFGYFEETLYRKKTGEMFLYGEGGPMSHYSVSCGQNSWSGGEKIIPLTDGEARKWAEQHLSADEYIVIFGDVEE